MEFAVPIDYREKIIEDEKGGMEVDLAREVESAGEHEVDYDTNRSWHA